jgi:ribosome biogenesis GTPase / thiamine phosphate phosphatase
MIEIDPGRLRPIGLTPAHHQHLLQQLADTAAGTARLMRVIEVNRETMRVHDGASEHRARVLPRLLRRLEDNEEALAVGDWVLADTDAHADLWLHERLLPLTHLTRRDGSGHRHPVVSNVDTALLVMGLDDDFNPRRLERYFALVQGSGVSAVVVLTKADVVGPDVADSALAQLRDRMPRGTDALVVNGTDPRCAQRLAPYLGAGQTLVLLGSSGAGKSTLTNSLLGTEVQDTGAVRAHDSRGKHTTTSRSLHCLPGGACVIDTPGLRALRPDVDEATLGATFADIDALAAQCRFRDCKHHAEPGCAVRAGVPPDRLRNYHKLLREARRDTLSALDRQRLLATWKARSHATAEYMRAKRGAR